MWGTSLGGMFHKRVLLGVIAVISIAARSNGEKTLGFDAVLSVGEEDFGNPNPPVDTGTSNGQSLPLQQSMSVDGDPYVMGKWSPVASWPICPIHAILLKDGKVLTYGTNPNANGGSGFYYDVWDPNLGMGEDSHQTLEVTTDTNIFCSGQVNLPDSGEVLILGGSQVKNGLRNMGDNTTQFFNPEDKSLRRGSRSMAYSRWYPSVTTLGSGNILVQGGRDDNRRPAFTPEFYNTQSDTWEQLNQATSPAVYGAVGWWYPRSYLASDGSVVVVPPGRGPERGTVWKLKPRDVDPLKKVADLDGVTIESPSVMYDTNKVLIFQDAWNVSIMNIQDPQEPQIQRTDSLSQRRNWANTVGLPNGEVLLVGGTSVRNEEASAVYYVEIWNPETGLWRTGASAAKSRLYHSTALLLPDGSVLVGGGGPPGDIVNQNAEIYYPPYLYKNDGSAELAPRPRIETSTDGWTVRYSQKLDLNLIETTSAISRVSFIRLGSVTHSFNMEERMQQLIFEQIGDLLVVQIPQLPNVTPPGYYMLFAVDGDGVPSESIIVHLLRSTISPLIESHVSISSGSATAANELGFFLELNANGQLILKQQAATGDDIVLWQTDKSGPSGSYTSRLQGNCNLVIKEGPPSNQGPVLWSSYTHIWNNKNGCFLAVLPDEQRIVTYIGAVGNAIEEVWTQPFSSPAK